MNLMALLSYVIIANISPGPNTVISMSNASRYELKKSIKFNLGVFAGAFIVLFLCSIFSITILNIFPSIKLVMIWVGAGYILWLAWQTYKSEPLKERDANRSNNLFLQGTFLQFANPNTILYGLTVFSTFIVPYHQSPIVLVLFCMILSLFAFIGTACWTLFGSVFRKIVVKHGIIINNIMAILLLYCAASLVLCSF